MPASTYLRVIPQAFVAIFLAVFLPPALAQEDVAETKASATIDPAPISEPPITAQDRAHWAFKPIVRPPLPSIRNPQSEIRNRW